jgi:hypothetical protein
MTNNTPSNLKGWQNKAKIAQQLQNLMSEYKMRKSKLIKYIPTEKELRDAMRFYSYILELSEEEDPNAIKLKEILNSVSDVPEEQIKFTGFMEESLKNYPTGEIPHEFLMNTAEKWDVLEYVVEDIIRVIGIKLNKS